MKTLTISLEPISGAELLEMARNDFLLIKTDKGDSFLVSHADEFATEVELLRQNHKFLSMLDKFKEEQSSISLDQVEKQLR
ncbi:MAG: hypothetical protein WCP58_11465 [bacterium]